MWGGGTGGGRGPVNTTDVFATLTFFESFEAVFWTDMKSMLYFREQQTVPWGRPGILADWRRATTGERIKVLCPTTNNYDYHINSKTSESNSCCNSIISWISGYLDICIFGYLDSGNNQFVVASPL